MAILDFMPKFAPWYTKTLLKKEDEPATDPSTGFFGDVFNFIDDAFAWTPTPEPVEPDWGGASLGAGFGEQAPAYEPYIEPDYSGMGDPFGMTDPFTEEDWTSAPSTPSSFTGPILGGMFGSAAPYAPPPPPSGIGDAIGGSLGSGEGWGFDLIDEPTQSWRGYAPPPSNFSGGIAGGMFGAEPAPTSYPDISAQWQDTDWVAAPPRESFGDNFGMDFRDRLDASIGERDPWADVQNWEGMPEPSADTSEWGQLAGIPGNGIGSAIGGAFSDFGTSLGSQIQEPIQFAPREDLDSGWLGGSGGAELGAYAPSVDRTQLSDIGYFPVGWDQMSPKERGEYVYFSGLRGNDYLSESDYANMPVDLKQKIGYADSRTEGGINNVFGKTWDVIDTAFTQPLQLMGDLAYDPAKSALSQIDPLGVPGLISGNPASFIGAGRDLWQGRDELEAPLDETVANVQDSSNPFEFFDKQGEDFKDRPFYEQLLLGLITPGSGIYKNASFAPKGLRAFDSALDFAQGGALLDNLGTIPGATSAMRNVIVPGAAGGGLGAATEAIFDPTYQDQFGNEYDPGYLEMILGGTALGIGGNAAMRSGTVPFGAAIEDAGRRIPLSGVRWKATYLDDPTIPPVPGKPTYGLPNTKGAPKKMPVKLEWEDPIDQAFYQASSGGKAKTSDEIYRMLEDKGFERADIMEAGNLIRDYLARTTRGFTGGETIRVPKIVRQSVATDVLSTVPPTAITEATGSADDFIAQKVTDQARRAGIPERVANELDDSAIDYLERLPRIPDGGLSDGRFVREEIPNTSSISSSLDEYHTVGIRDFPMSEFVSGGGYTSASDRQRVRDLAEAISESGEINPLIVVIDKDGPYILEGAHRLDALRELGAESFPAYVVVDIDEATGLGYKGANALSTVPPSIANPVDEIIGSSTVPPIKKLTVAQQKLPFAEQRAILGDAPDANQPGYLTWIDENNRINSMEAKTPEWREANRETITPSEDIRIGVNDSGDVLYERPSDGLRYRVRKDTGRVDTGGNLAPSSDTAVTAPVTPPVTASSPSVADGAVEIPTPKPVISRPVPADLSPAARNAVEQIDAKLDNLISVDSKLRREEFNLRQSQIAEDARQVARDQGLDEYQILQAGNAASKGFSIDDLVPIAGDPGRLRLTAEEMKEVAKVINARTKNEQIRNAAGRILKEWANGEKVSRYDFDTLRTAITGTWNPKGPRTINSIVTPPTGTADEIAGAASLTPKVTPVPKGVDVNKPVPGMKQPINKTIDEVADLPLTPAEKNTIGIDDDFFMEEPIDVVEDEWVDINDWWRDPDVITPGAQQGPPKPRRTPAWKTAIAEAEAQADDQVIDFTKPAVADDAVIDFTGAAAKKTNPVIQEVDAWEKQMLARGQGADPEKFQKELDRSMTELVARLGPDSVKPAQFSRDRIPGRIARLAETAKADRMALGTKSAIADWRKMNTPELDKMKMFANTSWGERWVGGALKNKLADALTSRGRELSEFLQKQGYSFEESKAITEMELSRYLDARTLREAQNGNPNAMLEHALTALHMGDFRPTREGIEVAEGTGDVAGFIQGARTGNAALKNLFFGVADVGALMANAIPAVQAQGIPLAVGYLNRLTKLVDIDEAKRLEDLAGLAPASAQDVLDDKVGTLAGVAGRFLQGTGAKKAGDVLVKADQVPVALNRLLEKVQFDLVLSRALRQPAYEGNVVLLKLLGRDITDPKVLRAASRMANAATSAAPLARGNTRRGLEGATLGSARFLRAQADLILAASKIINPRATPEERIVASMAILSLGGTFFAAKAIAGEKMEVDPKNPYSFGQILLPGGLIMPSLQQRQLAMAFNKSGQELAKVLTDNDGDVSKIMDPWIQFTISRVGPLGAVGLKQVGIGYDPKEDRYSYPGEGRSPWGSSMSFAERMKNVLPIPVGATAFMDNEGPTYGKVLNVAGANTRPEEPFAAALRAEGYDSLEDMEAEDPKTYSSRKAAFYEKYPDIFEQDTALADYQAAKKSNSEKFMENDYKFTVGDWREKRKSISDGMGGVYNELGVEEKQRPKENGSAQWIYDYNQTFSDALVNTENTAEGMDMEKLGDLQAEFWAEHPEPEVRKEILDYQLAKADTEADKLWIKSMARLNGIDPNTGGPLKTASGKRTLPNYFEMERYEYDEIPNEDAQDVIARFVQWRDSLDQDVVADMEREDLIRMFIEKKPDLAYRPDSKSWTEAAIRDVINYGNSAMTPEYEAYKEYMRPELLWFSDDKSWKTIKDAHKKAGRE